MKYFAILMLLPGFLSAQPMQKKNIVFFGDSITAGYGLTVNDAYPALIQKKIDELHWPFVVVNAGLSGDTTSAGLQRLSWVLRQNVDVIVIALGANDGLRGVDPELTKSNLQKMIDLIRAKSPNTLIVLAGMKMPPNFGAEYARHFSSVFPELATQNKIASVPFLLEGVGGVAALNQGDGVHPTAEGQKRIAETVWKNIKPLLAQRL